MATTRLIWHIWRPHHPLSWCVTTAWQYGRDPLVACELHLYFFNLNLRLVFPYDRHAPYPTTTWQQCLVTLWPPPHTPQPPFNTITTWQQRHVTQWGPHEWCQEKKLLNLDQGRSIRISWCVVCTRYLKLIFLMFSRTVYRNTAIKVAVPYRPSLQKLLYSTGMAKTYPFWTVKLTAITVIRYGVQPY